MQKITVRQLRTLVEIAQKQSFVRAAEALHLTPPAVTMQIKDLEASLGLPLIDRGGGKISLTTAGEYMVFYARRVLGTLKEAENMMARLKHMEVGSLNIGLVSTAKYFLPRLLARFHEQYPDIEIRLQVCMNRDQLLTLLRGNEIDLAIMGRPPKEIATRVDAIAGHPHVFVAPPDHKLLKCKRVTARDLDGLPFIMREPGSGTRKHLMDFLATHEVKPHLAMEMPSNESIKQAVMAGMGLSFLSLHTIGLEARNGLIAVLPVAGTPIMRTWNVVNLAGKVLSPAAEALRNFILEQTEEQLAEHDRELLQASA